ncbi:MAG: hypothetical protein QOC81_1885 [Thermoanaerobaculia bacterium]|jgi:hypothetical protein|nr:hypothetical protein [Thermoanaerobaculia bacterium]
MNALPVATVFALVLSSGFALGQETAADVLTPVATSEPYIRNIATFLQQCPDRDPAYAEISRDFEIRRNDKATAAPACTEPISAIPIAQYTDELIVRQGLRVIYYMDRGQSGHLPWTSGALYPWMKSKIQGINIVDGVVGGYCCATLDGKRFIVIGNQNDSNRDFDRTWSGISGNIDFYTHEARHVDGFPHSSCCGIANGCDDNFDPNNLSAYGVQWWLNSLWLNGTINVGDACAGSAKSSAQWFLSGMNSQYRGRFCTIKPDLVSLPAVPEGSCPPQPRHRSAKK